MELSTPPNRVDVLPGLVIDSSGEPVSDGWYMTHLSIHRADPAAPLPVGYWLLMRFNESPLHIYGTCSACSLFVDRQAGGGSPDTVANEINDGEVATGNYNRDSGTVEPGTDHLTFMNGDVVGVYLGPDTNQLRVQWFYRLDGVLFSHRMDWISKLNIPQ